MKDLSGLRFSRWLVISFSHKKKYDTYWNCRCDCGVKRRVIGKAMQHGRSKSCGCLQNEAARKSHTTHNMTGSPEHISWVQMRARCENKNIKAFPGYGGRGIVVCERWQKFENFYSDMGHRPIGMTLERKNNDKGYSPSNCVWADKKDQASNRRSNVFLDTPWGRLTQADAARKLEISASTLCIRMKAWPASRWFEQRRKQR